MLHVDGYDQKIQQKSGIATGTVVSQGTSRPNAENCSAFPPPTRQSASTCIEAELLGLTSIYSEIENCGCML